MPAQPPEPTRRQPVITFSSTPSNLPSAELLSMASLGAFSEWAAYADARGTYKGEIVR